MADEDYEWISPRQRNSPPKRQRVTNLRQKYEALSQEPSRYQRRADHDESGSSQERSYYHGPHRGYRDQYQSDSSYRSDPNEDPSYEEEEAMNEEEESFDEPSFSKVLESTRRDERETEDLATDPSIEEFEDRAQLASGKGEYDIYYDKLGQTAMDNYLHEFNFIKRKKPTEQEIIDEFYRENPEFAPKGYVPPTDVVNQSSEVDRTAWNTAIVDFTPSNESDDFDAIGSGTASGKGQGQKDEPKKVGITLRVNLGFPQKKEG